MDEDVPMDDAAPGEPSEAKPKDELDQYNLDDYDNDDGQPGAYMSWTILHSCRGGALPKNCWAIV